MPPLRGGLIGQTRLPRIPLRSILHPTDEDLSVGTPAWAILDASLWDDRADLTSLRWKETHSDNRFCSCNCPIARRLWNT